MFDRIEMDIIDMPRKVAVVADGMLPKSPLPKREIVIGPALEMKPRLDQGAAEMPLDSPPAAGKICIVCWQGKNGVQMIRENHNGVDRKWPCAASRLERRTQHANVVHKSGRAPVSECNREEIGSARNKVASISDHPRQSVPHVAALMRAT